MWKKIFANWEAALFWFIIGSLVTGLTTYTMNRETTRLLNLSLRSIESAGLGIEYSYDKKGRINELIIKGRGNATLPPQTASGKGTVGPPPSGKPEKSRE